MENIEKLSLDDIIFSGRNQMYGGYMLRRMYGQRLVRGALIGVILCSLLLAEPIISEKLFGLLHKKEADKYKFFVEELPPLINDTKKLPPPPPPPPPARDIKKLIPPTVTLKPEPKDVPPLPPDFPKNADIGTTDIKGDTSIKTYSKPVDVTPPPPPKDPEPEKTNIDERVICWGPVEQKPEFPNGEAAMFKFLCDNIKYPSIARENNIAGTVYIGFVVNTDGSIQDVTIKRGVGGGCSEEALHVVNMMPKWKPGRQQGRPVRVSYTLPVKFHLE